jgi:hypothetical protein
MEYFALQFIFVDTADIFNMQGLTNPLICSTMISEKSGLWLENYFFFNFFYYSRPLSFLLFLQVSDNKFLSGYEGLC